LFHHAERRIVRAAISRTARQRRRAEMLVELCDPALQDLQLLLARIRPEKIVLVARRQRMRMNPDLVAARRYLAKLIAQRRYLFRDHEERALPSGVLDELGESTHGVAAEIEIPDRRMAALAINRPTNVEDVIGQGWGFLWRRTPRDNAAPFRP